MSRLLLAAGLALGCLTLCVLPRPALNNSIESMLVDDSPSALRYADFQAHFGADELLVISAAGPDREALFGEVIRLERALLDEPEVQSTLGPASAYEDEFDLLLDAEMGGWGALDGLKSRFEGPLAKALRLAEFDPPSARIFAFCRPGKPEARHRLSAVLAQARARFASVGATLRVAGPPLLNLELDRAGRDVERVSLPILVAICVALLLGLTRSVRLAIAALIPVGLGVGATEGLLSVLGHDTDIIINIAKPLMFVLLLATGLHVVVAWQDARFGGASPAEAPWLAARRKARACALALGTTALGFASLGISEMPSVRTFGLLSAAGLFLGLPLVLVVLPALLQLLGGRSTPSGGRALGEAAAWCVGWSLRRPWVFPLGAVLIVLAGIAALAALPVSTGGVHYFDDSSQVRQDYDAILADGLGLSSVEVVLTSEAPGKLVTDARLGGLDAFATAVEALPTVRTAVGLPLFLRESQWRLIGEPVLPRGSVLDEAMASDALAVFTDADGRRLRLSLVIEHLDAPELEALYAQVRALHATHLAGAGLALTLTGHHELVVQAQAALVDTLLSSLTVTALLITCIVLIALRSWRMAAAAFIPMILPVCLNFGLMWALDIPLDLGTCMTGAIALGIAVDDALHFMMAWRVESPMATARGTGRALVLTTLVISLGFVSLLGAAFEPTARFGLLSAAAMASALLADLLVLPPMLRWLAPRESGAAS